MLDNSQEIKSKDKLNVLESTENLWLQCQQAWDDVRQLELPDSYRDIDKIVLAGMGGSHLGGNFIQSVFKANLRLPLIIESDYNIPGYVDQKTLVIACSYSGTTEEVLSFYDQANQLGAKLMVISSGNALIEKAAQDHIPYYCFESKYNPSRIPRYGSGYMFMSLLNILQKVHAIQIAPSEIEQAISMMKLANQDFGLESPTGQNLAKQLAQSMHDKVVILVASEHLVGPTYIFKNQINESAKTFSTMFEIPELNHHLLEGLAHPKSNQNALEFIFIGSDLYHARNQKRHQITAEIIQKQDIKIATYQPKHENRLVQAFETLAFTSYVALYLSILNQVDPGPNPWVDYLKTTLGQSLGK